MKTHCSKKILPLLSILGAVAMTSCVDPGYAGGYNSNRSGYSSNRGGYNTYTTLPPNYSGSAYLYNGRYYSGGNYQTGRYNNQGRSYDSRYYHNGQYYYGGSHAHYPGDGHNHGQTNLGSPYGSSRSSYRSF